MADTESGRRLAFAAWALVVMAIIVLIVVAVVPRPQKTTQTPAGQPAPTREPPAAPRGSAPAGGSGSGAPAGSSGATGQAGSTGTQPAPPPAAGGPGYQGTGLPAAITFRGQKWHAAGAPFTPGPGQEYAVVGATNDGRAVYVARSAFGQAGGRVFLRVGEKNEYVAYAPAG